LLGDERVTYRPSVDITYASAAKAFGNKVLAVIMTGMGADGAEGAKLLKQGGAVMWAQNEESCTIYGMPQAVVKSGLADEILDLNDIGPLLAGKGRL
jgi:two-component system chemotaxis response regulator CheB